MLTSKPSKEMILNWQKIYRENYAKLKPNRKSGWEVDEYFKNSYVYKEIQNKTLEEVVLQTILLNDFYREKLPSGKIPKLKTYLTQDIYVGIDTVSGFFHVEGEDTRGVAQIYDDLFLFRGLDEKDLRNYFLTAQYLLLQKIQGL